MVVAVTAALAAAVLRSADGPASDLTLPWWVVATGFATTESFVVHLHFRDRDAYTLSLSEIPLVFGLFTVSPAGLLVARLVGAVTLVLVRRQRGLKLVFNVANFGLETCVALVVFRLLADVPVESGLQVWSATFAAVLAADVVGACAVTAAISLHAGGLQRRMVTNVVPSVLLGAASNTSLALLAVTILWVDPAASWLLGVVVAILFLGYRAYSSLHQRYENVKLLYQFTRATDGSGAGGPPERVLLGKARELMRAEVAALELAIGDDGALARTELRADGTMTTTLVPAPAPGAGGPHAAALGGQPVLMARTARDEDARGFLAAHGVKDAMLAPLRSEGGILGLISVANRLGEVSTFDGEDLKLFETLANHATVSLENSRLIDRLRHQAFHDDLTGLPNRKLFGTEVEAAIARAADGCVSVMLLNLDHFKEVNDTLGHHHGDLLLKAVAERLSASARARAVVAHLASDQFGVVAPDLVDATGAIAEAARLRAALEAPFDVGGISLDVRASVGIALSPDHSREPATLLQMADVALDEAKEGLSGVHVYSSERDRYSPRRLALAAELRRAIGEGEITLYYQPKVDAETGSVVGVEALARWPHAVHGFVPPDEFISIAEHTGLIRPLTAYVLDLALAQCRAWADEGLQVPVAVNVSARNLLEGELSADVAGALANRQVDAGMLTLEITETSMADVARTTTLLERLRDMGVKLSVDDFGTGYSSLSYLKRLPVHEVKIDRSFVQNVASDWQDASIVRAVVQLAASHGLHVVAEGVEDEATWAVLRGLGCHVVQGYLLSKPRPADDLTPWLRAGEPAHAPDPVWAAFHGTAPSGRATEAKSST